jgi:HK97 family phage portal protein
MNALAKAFSDVDRSYFSAKASVANATSALLAQGPGGVLSQSTDFCQAEEQLKHFTSWVYACIRPIAQKIAAQPIRVGLMKKPSRLKKATLEAFDSHPLLDLLADPNELQVAWSLMFVTVASLELTGRCLWWLPERKQILPIPSNWIVSQEGSTRIDSFKIRPPKTAEAFDVSSDQCCYFSYPNPADPHGVVSPLQAVGAAVDADESITDSQRAMFRRGIHPSHAIIVGKNPHPDMPGGIRPHLTGVQQRQIISAILKRYAGTSKNEPLILDGMIEDIRKLSNTPEEMDWLNSSKLTKERISQGFGVNPIIMGQVEGANRASATAADKHFCDFTVNPKIELMSQCMTEWLSPMFGGGIKIWIEPCIPDDADLSLEWASLLAQSGIITANELRHLSPFGAALTEDKEFLNQLVGGQNMSTTNPIEAGIKKIFRNELGAFGADKIMEMLNG